MFLKLARRIGSCKFLLHIYGQKITVVKNQSRRKAQLRKTALRADKILGGF